MPKALAGDTANFPALGSIERSTLNDLAYEKLKRALLTGRIESGMVLTFRNLASELGTSMMPVREAVARLVAERALEVVPQRGIRVPTLTSEELEDLWNLRVQLEGEAAARSAARATPENVRQISLLRDLVREAAESGDVYRFQETNSDFMFAIYAAAQTRVFIALVEMLRVQASPHRNDAIRVLIEERPPFFAAMLRRHDELVEAIAAHDAARARAIKQEDIEEFRELFNAVAARNASTATGSPITGSNR
jgi:DNA-binding GntR family transcriptional regulator